MFCSKCGKELREDAAFCDSCGSQIIVEYSTKVHKETTPNIPTVLLSYIISIPTAIISFCLRVSHWEFLDTELFMAASFRKVYGVAPNKKPMMVCLPIVALILVFLLVLVDKKLSTKKKIFTLISAGVLIVASILFICCTGVDKNPFNILSRLFW